MSTIPSVEAHLWESFRNRTRRLPVSYGKASYPYVRGLISLLRKLKGK